MNAVVLYVSRTGFTRRYAQWIGQALDCPVLEERAAEENTLDRYDTVICGGWLNAEKVAGKKQFLRWKEKFPDKRFVFFATGATPLEHKEYLENIAEKSGLAPFFYFPGGLNYEAMGTGDRLKLKTFSKMLAAKGKSDPKIAALAQAVSHSFDLSRQEYIAPLVELLRA